jgi:hypothetical protein
MTFWTGVAVGYVVVVAVGLTVGRLLAEGLRRGGDGRHRGPDPAPAPAPVGPSHALDDCPPLGSAFDRALLPGVLMDATLDSV